MANTNLTAAKKQASTMRLELNLKVYRLDRQQLFAWP